MNAYVQRVIEDTKKKNICPKCGKYLYNSDIKSYEYICYNCEENFYGIEVK